MHLHYQTDLMENTSQQAPLANPTPQNQHWTDLFARDFLIKTARSKAEKEQVYRLRHQVYCEELAFEPVRPAGLELDQYDRRSVHCLLEHQQSQSSAGTLRLIACNDTTEHLPLEHYFQQNFTRPEFAPDMFDREQICELSRLAVAPAFRKNQQCQTNPVLSQLAAVSNNDQYTHYRYISAGLYLAALEQTRLLGIQHAYVVVAPALARMLNRVGFQFVQISQPIELNGCRAAYYLDVKQCFRTLCRDYHLLWQVLADQMQRHYTASLPR